MGIQSEFDSLSFKHRLIKRSFDFSLSLLGLLLSWWLILLAALLAWIDTRSSGFFLQNRVGKYGQVFKVIKIRTMRSVPLNISTITAANDDRITKFGSLLRRSKIDELPQLVNVLLGQMSFVGPRPDVPGYADKLSNEDRVILSVSPGITGPATLAYRDEERMLASQNDPIKYNDEVIFPRKVVINRKYIQEYSFGKDLSYIWQTIYGK
ncbi:MAG: sugar transferase [Gammaproteobacteria bacterium]|nr:sugar transferase [Gammaproteobacteria bacterium]